MNEQKKTIAFAAVALLLAATAALATRPRGGSAAAFNDQGELFFPEFTDPLACTALEVIDFDPETASALPFKVMLKDGRWIIPSHYSYPADAKDRLAKTAAGFIDIRKDTIRTDRPEDHRGMGVLDPLNKKLTSAEGVGKRVTLRDKSDKILADLIIGKEIPGQTDQHYVRRPDQNRVYGVKLKVDPSARFADWIEANLLKLEASRLRKFKIDTHKVDPEAGQIIPGEVFEITRADASAPWTMAGLTPEQELDSGKLSTLTSALGDLKIAGVRPKPQGLSDELKAADERGLKMTRAILASLASKGFHLTRDGRLLSNEGDIYATTDQGVVYTLRFGEVTFAQGEALSAGTTEGAEAKDKGNEKDKKAEGVESRYLFVTAQFNKDLIPPPVEIEADTELPADPFARTRADRAAKAKERQEKFEKDKTDYDRKVDEGKKKAKELTDRFAGWYYVVPGDAYRSIVLDRNALVRSKPPVGTPAGMPAMPPPGSDPFGGLKLPRHP
jgi:hypothetical protein